MGSNYQPNDPRRGAGSDGANEHRREQEERTRRHDPSNPANWPPTKKVNHSRPIQRRERTSGAGG